MTDLERYDHRCNGGMNIMGLIHNFLIGLKATGANSCLVLYCTHGQEPMDRKDTDPVTNILLLNAYPYTHRLVHLLPLIKESSLLN